MKVLHTRNRWNRWVSEALLAHSFTGRDVSCTAVMPRRRAKNPVASWAAELGQQFAILRGRRGQQWLADEMARIRPPKRPGRQSGTPGKGPERGKQAVSNLENGYNVTLETIDTALRALGATLHCTVTPVDTGGRARGTHDGGTPVVAKNRGYYIAIGDWWDELSPTEQKQLHRLAESFHESRAARKIAAGEHPND